MPVAFGLNAAEESRYACLYPTPTIEPHKQTYALPVAYDYRVGDADDRRPREFKFQYSLRSNVLHCKWFPLDFGYTQKSFWQVYDQERSSPFRESNYNPELFVDFQRTVLHGTPYGLQIGIEHESNGQSVERSRSWNRSYVRGSLWLPPFGLSLKLWDRWDERRKLSPTDARGDDNPEIRRYLGTWELYLHSALPWRLDASLWLRRSVHPYRPSFEFNLDRYLLKDLWLRVQHYSGFGESLIDYDRRVSRAGIGIVLKPRDPANREGRLY